MQKQGLTQRPSSRDSYRGTKYKGRDGERKANQEKTGAQYVREIQKGREVIRGR